MFEDLEENNLDILAGVSLSEMLQSYELSDSFNIEQGEQQE